MRPPQKHTDRSVLILTRRCLRVKNHKQPRRISNWGQIGRLQVAATIAKSTCVDYTSKLKCTQPRLQVAATIAKSTCVDYTPKLKCTQPLGRISGWGNAASSSDGFAPELK